MKLGLQSKATDIKAIYDIGQALTLVVSWHVNSFRGVLFWRC